MRYKLKKISNIKISQLIFFQFISHDNSKISFLFSGLDSRNGTYASLAFISGVERKKSSTRCGITAFLKSVKKCYFFKNTISLIHKLQNPKHVFISF